MKLIFYLIGSLLFAALLVVLALAWAFGKAFGRTAEDGWIGREE